MTIINRNEYLNKHIIGKFKDETYFESMNEQDAKNAIANRDKLWAMLRKWGNHDITFTPQMMEKYSPQYKGKNALAGFVGMPFKNIGHPALSRQESMLKRNQKYFGKSSGRSISEFLSDAMNPKNIIKKKLMVIT
jgi:hypothetical protein